MNDDLGWIFNRDNLLLGKDHRQDTDTKEWPRVNDDIEDLPMSHSGTQPANKMFQDADLGLPDYRRLYQGIRNAILDGILRPGQKLPASRALAKHLGVSRNTIITSFELLASEGYIESKTGSGSFVSSQLPDRGMAPAYTKNAAIPLNAKIPENTPDKKPDSRISPLSSSIQRAQKFERRFPNKAALRPFNPTIPDLSAFPFDIWARLLRRTWRSPLTELAVPVDSMGFYPLREQIAQWLYASRGVRCQAHQVMIVSGAQQALDLIARVLIDPGASVAIEYPGYEGIRGVLAASGAQICPLPVDADGMQLDPLYALARPPKMVVVTPSRCYPLGTSLSLARRLSLLQWAAQNDSWIIEDDYDCDYRYDGAPLSSLQGLDRNQRVLYVGTFSRVMFPGIRLGYLVMPEHLIDSFRSMRSFADGVPPTTAQSALEAFFAEGHFESHVRRMRLLYAERRAHLQKLITENASEHLRVLPSDGGLFLCCELLNRASDQDLFTEIHRAGLECRALSSYFTSMDEFHVLHSKTTQTPHHPFFKQATPQGLLLGFAGWGIDELSKGFCELINILERKT